MLGDKFFVVELLFEIPAAWAFVADMKERDSSKFI